MKTTLLFANLAKVVLELDTRGGANNSIANKCVSDEFNCAKLHSTSPSKPTQPVVSQPVSDYLT